jgi:hypothetical protein
LLNHATLNSKQRFADVQALRITTTEIKIAASPLQLTHPLATAAQHMQAVWQQQHMHYSQRTPQSIAPRNTGHAVRSTQNNLHTSCKEVPTASGRTGHGPTGTN